MLEQLFKDKNEFIEGIKHKKGNYEPDNLR